MRGSPGRPRCGPARYRRHRNGAENSGADEVKGRETAVQRAGGVHPPPAFEHRGVEVAEIGRWDSTLVMTYSEFGRRPRENLSSGTDHGTASAHLVMGGRVRGGLYGEQPALDRLDSTGNAPFVLDFRRYYATFLERHWEIASAEVLGGRFTPLDFI